MAFCSKEKTIPVSEFERNDSTWRVQAMIGTLKEMINPFVDDLISSSLQRVPSVAYPRLVLLEVSCCTYILMVN
jgi:hypothetical protein